MFIGAHCNFENQAAIPEHYFHSNLSFLPYNGSVGFQSQSPFVHITPPFKSTEPLWLAEHNDRKQWDREFGAVSRDASRFPM